MKIITSSILSALLTAAIGYFFLLPELRNNYIAIGEANGSISEKWKLAEMLKREFPANTQGCTSQSVLFEVKSTSVYVATCNGIRTLLVED